MEVETTRMSTRGQIVIPQSIREQIDAVEGSLFAVTGKDDMIMLKKIKKPTKESMLQDLNRIAEKNRKKLEQKGVKEEDLHTAVEKRRNLHESSS